MNKYPVAGFQICLLFFVLCGCGLRYNEAFVLEEKPTTSDSLLFKNFQALQVSNSKTILSGELIQLTISNFRSKNHKQTFRKIKNEFAEKGKLISEDDENLVRPNRIWLRKLMINDTLFQYNIIYALANSEYNVKVIDVTYFHEDEFLKVDSISRYISNHGIPEEVFTDISAANVNFIGRDLNLDQLCEWESVYVLQCADKGKIRWSLHQNLQAAERAKNIHKAFSKSYKYSKLLSEETVDVIFEGDSIKADRLVFGLKKEGVFSRNNERMIIYYLATQVRGHYIHSVLSFYEDQAVPGGLPSLIKEVMLLPE